MKSETCTAPAALSYVVSRMVVSGTYRCETDCAPSTSMEHRPPLASSSKAANTLGESKRGKHAQSIDPSRLTSAHEFISPMSP